MNRAAPEKSRTTLNVPIGTRELCAWQPVPGVTWVQARLPEHANRLAKRLDGRLVVRSMAGGYLKTFEFRHPLSWARRLISRYTRTCQNHTANGRKSSLVAHGTLELAEGRI
ncbi:MAG: hypothetical protein WAO02_06575 [Verrucomicrobiia bacterium]